MTVEVYDSAGKGESEQLVKEARRSQNYSDISERNLQTLEEGMSLKEVLQFINEGMQPRTLLDILEKYYQGNLRDRLYQGMYEIESRAAEKKLGRALEEAERKTLSGSISRNVRNWLNSGKVPSRENLFKICYALKLDFERADELIVSASETGIHLRNPDEIIYAYGLVNHLQWDDMQELKGRLQSAQRKNDRRQGQLLYTDMIRGGFFDVVHDERRFCRFYEMQRLQFSYTSETVHRKFTGLMKALKARQMEGRINKDDRTEGLDAYTGLEIAGGSGSQRGSVKGIVESFQLEKTGKEGKRTDLQKMIQKNWPTKDVLDSMLEKKRPVTRKTLILLMLELDELEEASLTKQEWRYIDSLSEKEEELPEARMIRRLIMLNKSLESCNMKRLDPRNAFDCLVLYALKSSCENDTQTMSYQIVQTINYLLNNSSREE